VRNPLFGISSTVDALEAHLGSREDYRKHFSVLRSEVERLSRLMGRLLEYGKPATWKLSPTTIDRVIAEAVRSVAALASQSQVEICNHGRPRAVTVMADQEQLSQALENLLENAIQHSPPGGKILIGAERIREGGRDWVDCTIQDAGPGFPAEDLPLIFEPFFTRRRGGIGLGLPLAQRIVEGHGGRLSASNLEMGGGVTTVRLPAGPDRWTLRWENSCG
jgi:signal transduction histidine kinase